MYRFAILGLWLQLILISCFSQEYFEYNRFLTKISKSFNTGNGTIECQENILFYYDSAFLCVNNKPYPRECIKAAKIAIRIGENEKALTYLSYAIDYGYPYKNVKKDLGVDWNDFKKSDQYLLLREFKTNTSAHEYNKQLNRKVNIMIFRDQRYRIFTYKPLKQHLKDSLNAATLDCINSDIGRLPGLKDIKPNKLVLLNVVYLHMSPVIACKNANRLLWMYKHGEFQDIRFIFEVLDQASYRYGTNFGYENGVFCILGDTKLTNKINFHKQSFGTQMLPILENGTWTNYFIPVNDKQYADSIREIFGFCRLDEENELCKYRIYDEQYFISKWGEFK